MDKVERMREIIAKYGEEIYGDKNRLRAAIDDGFSAGIDIPLKKNLQRAVEEGIPEKLLQMKNVGAEYRAQDIFRIFAAFKDENAIIHEIALETVSIFSMALLGVAPLQSEKPASATVDMPGHDQKPTPEQPRKASEGVRHPLNPEATAELLNLSIYAVPERVRQLIQKGADVNAVDKYGRTPLHTAAMNSYQKNPEWLRILINAGANVNAACNAGWTPLHAAASRAATLPEALHILINAGADVNAATEYGETPLHFAARHGENPEALHVLIDAGADVNADCNTGWTPLHAATLNLLNENPVTLSVLIGAGACVNVVDKYGKTPLMLAAASWTLNLDRLLRLSRQAERGPTPAKRNYILKCLRLLLEAGADANIIDNSGKKALDYAKDHSFLTGTDEYRLLEGRTSPN